MACYLKSADTEQEGRGTLSPTKILEEPAKPRRTEVLQGPADPTTAICHPLGHFQAPRDTGPHASPKALGPAPAAPPAQASNTSWVWPGQVRVTGGRRQLCQPWVGAPRSCP